MNIVDFLSVFHDLRPIHDPELVCIPCFVPRHYPVFTSQERKVMLLKRFGLTYTRGEFGRYEDMTAIDRLAQVPQACAVLPFLSIIKISLIVRQGM